MPDATPPLPIARPHNNRQLFSDHYLDVLLPRLPAWHLLLEEAGRVRSAIAAILDRYTPSPNEAQTERDLGTPVKQLNQKLTAWWNLDLPALRAELHKTFKRDIPVAQRDKWEQWLAARQSEHRRQMAETIRIETALNAHVYTVFNLTPEEIAVVEESTKYCYGEV